MNHGHAGALAALRPPGGWHSPPDERRAPCGLCGRCGGRVAICSLALHCAHGGYVHVETGAHYCDPSPWSDDFATATRAST